MCGQGLAAHLLCFDGMLLPKQLLWLSPDKCVLSVEPFERESPFTRFYDGLLLAVRSEFPADLFADRMCGKTVLLEELCVDSLYRAYAALGVGDRCAVYQFDPVDWAAGRLLPESRLVRVG